MDVVVVANDAQSQTTLLITQEPRRRGSGDPVVGSPSRIGFGSASGSSSASLQQARQLQQSRLVLEKRLESNVTSFPPLDPNFAEDYVFQVWMEGDVNELVGMIIEPLSIGNPDFDLSFNPVFFIHWVDIGTIFHIGALYHISSPKSNYVLHSKSWNQMFAATKILFECNFRFHI